MTEAEAISICKNIIRAINGDTCYFNYSKEQDKEAIETLLELYHKQKEEINLIKELNLQDNRTLNMQGEVLEMYKNNFISKDKIRDKIKEVNKRSAKGNITISALYYIETILKELLGE